MARFLFTVWPLDGHVHPNVAVAQALRARGDEVAFCSGASLRPLLDREGIRLLPFDRVNEVHVRDLIDRLAVTRSPVRRKALWGELLLGTIDAQLQDLERILAAWQPDVIVCDPAMWAPFLVLRETRDVPVAIFSYAAACILPGRYGPVVGLPVPRPRNRAERLMVRGLRSAMEWFLRDGSEAASDVRRRHGLTALRSSVTQFSATVPLYLVPSSPAFDYARDDLPASVRYVGPCLWNRPSDERAPAWIADLPTDRPLVYVSEGTVHRREPRLLHAAIAGLRDRPVQVVITTGRHRDPRELGLGDIPGNVRVERFVPLSDLLPRTAVVVTTGGSGTVMASLAHGVPLVVAPSDWDQHENAWRVAWSGAGVRLPFRGCRPAPVRAAIERVVQEPSFRQAAARLRDDLARRGGAIEAAELLRELAVRRLATVSA
jgi:MGT family glycosyltransferase